MSLFKRILVPVDGSQTSTQALVTATQLARERSGRVRLIHVVDELAYLTGYESSAEVIRIVREQGNKLLNDALAIAQSAGVEADVQLLDRPGVRLGEVVGDAARQWDADAIVVGTHGRRGMSRVVLGSGAEEILRTSNIPVLVVRGRE